MANKAALRELQTRLAERLKQARTQEQAESWLAVESGGRGLLFPLQEAGEIFPLGTLLSVPHTHRWFLGVANLRGGLCGVVDLAAFLRGGRPASVPVQPVAEPSREAARLVALNPALECNCALLVDRLAGLRNLTQLVPQPADERPRPAFAGTRFRDETGKVWQEIRLSALAADPAFLKIVN